MVMRAQDASGAPLAYMAVKAVTRMAFLDETSILAARLETI